MITTHNFQEKEKEINGIFVRCIHVYTDKLQTETRSERKDRTNGHGYYKKIYFVAAYFSVPATSHHQMQMPRGEYVCIY